MPTKGPLQEKSKIFAVRIVRLAQWLVSERKEFVLSKQLLRSGTSIGASLREARGAQSSADFLTKHSIALKEAYETEYWIELLAETGYLPSADAKAYAAAISELVSLLTRSVSTIKKKIAAESANRPSSRRLAPNPFPNPDSELFQ